MSLRQLFTLDCTFIIDWCGAGEKVVIPRIPIIPSDLSLQFKRPQVSIRVCFAMRDLTPIAELNSESS